MPNAGCCDAWMLIFSAEQASGLSWNDLVEEEELREPGRAVQMHEKLSSPSRKRYAQVAIFYQEKGFLPKIE